MYHVYLPLHNKGLYSKANDSLHINVLFLFGSRDNKDASNSEGSDLKIASLKMDVRSLPRFIYPSEWHRFFGILIMEQDSPRSSNSSGESGAGFH